MHTLFISEITYNIYTSANLLIYYYFFSQCSAEDLLNPILFFNQD